MDLFRFDQRLDPDRFGFGPVEPASVRNWVVSDSEELFNKNWKDATKRIRLIKGGWDQTSIVYRSNDRGFRMDQDFNDLVPGHGNFYLGCSITFGVGLNVEDTWAWKINQRIGGDFINLAWPGTGIETQYRMLRSWAGVLRPRRAYTLGAFSGRREIIDDRGMVIRLGPWTSGGDLDTYRRMSSENEIRISFIRSLDAMRAICMDLGIELYVPRIENISSMRQRHEHDVLARDLIHWGRPWHDMIASAADDWWERLV